MLWLLVFAHSLSATCATRRRSFRSCSSCSCCSRNSPWRSVFSVVLNLVPFLPSALPSFRRRLPASPETLCLRLLYVPPCFAPRVSRIGPFHATAFLIASAVCGRAGGRRRRAEQGQPSCGAQGTRRTPATGVCLLVLRYLPLYFGLTFVVADLVVVVMCCEQMPVERDVSKWNPFRSLRVRSSLPSFILAAASTDLFLIASCVVVLLLSTWTGWPCSAPCRT